MRTISKIAGPAALVLAGLALAAFWQGSTRTKIGGLGKMNQSSRSPSSQKGLSAFSSPKTDRGALAPQKAVTLAKTSAVQSSPSNMALVDQLSSEAVDLMKSEFGAHKLKDLLPALAQNPELTVQSLKSILNNTKPFEVNDRKTVWSVLGELVSRDGSFSNSQTFPEIAALVTQETQLPLWVLDPSKQKLTEQQEHALTHRGQYQKTKEGLAAGTYESQHMALLVLAEVSTPEAQQKLREMSRKPLSSSFQACTSPWTLSALDLIRGDNSIEIRAADRAGNITRVTRTWRLTTTQVSRVCGVQ
jgi:hypothetical protein